MSIDFKRASPAELKSAYDKIAKEMGDDQFFTKKELNHLPQILSEGEPVLAFTSGMMDGNTWLISLTDRRIIFLDKGLIYGLKQVAIDLDKVNSISGKTGIFFGDIRIEDAAAERQISNVMKKTVVPFTNKVRDAIEKRKQFFRSPISVVTQEDDVLSKLERLGSLLEKGVLTADEFAVQKARLLDR